MLQWTADFTNDPNNDYALIIEILCDGEDIGVIKHGKHGLEFVIFNHNQNIVIPFNWFLGLMNEAKNKLDKI
jgi:hypothetical protein